MTKLEQLGCSKPVVGLVLLVGMDRFVNAARAVTNLIGNGIGTIGIARWEKAFNEHQAEAILTGRKLKPGSDSFRI